MHELADAVHRRGLDYAPDYLCVDGGEGGSGAAPQALADHMSLSIEEALPRVVDSLVESGLRTRIRVVASGKLVTSARAAHAQQAAAACAGGGREVPARGKLREQHEPGDRHDCPLVRRAPCA
jgi:glutamate synthase domain-containing protein 2